MCLTFIQHKCYQILKRITLIDGSQSNNKNKNTFGATKMELLVYLYFAEITMAMQLFLNKK